MQALDLRGLLCPLTWARTKYALAKVEPGAELVVLVDHRPAVPDIRRNAEELGHEVLSARELDESARKDRELAVWELRIRRA
ncbi:MAG: sulfurtransferase TusA family protein [Deltaproteobacteria bacterium]|nr:sulfurtransferase TusA family protein [Deltaproteobacteria bacterium]